MFAFIRVLACAVAVAVAGAPLAPAAGQTAPPDKIRLSLNPGSYAYLPIFLAVDKGYFAEQHLDVQVTKYTGSSLTQLPMLARGDLDIAPVVTGPGFFNQFNQGFDLKLLASIDQSQKGWHDTGCLLVRQDIWDSGAVRKIADLKGKIVDGGLDGTAQNYLLKQAILKGGLKFSDMTYTDKFKTVPDQFAALHNKAVEVLDGAEPICTQMQAQGLAHKWLTFQDVIPGFQASFITSSASYLKTHRDAVKRFLIALLKAEKEIKAAKGGWTPVLQSTVAKWAEIPESVVATIPGPPYTGQFGAIDETSIRTQQAFWMNEGTVKQAVIISDIVDTSVLKEALKESGIAPTGR
jgi:NitT/TauT family transport system substrate-binding protein